MSKGTQHVNSGRRNIGPDLFNYGLGPLTTTLQHAIILRAPMSHDHPHCCQVSVHPGVGNDTAMAAPGSQAVKRKNCSFTTSNYLAPCTYPHCSPAILTLYSFWISPQLGAWAPKFTASVVLRSPVHIHVLENPCVFQI